MAIYFFDLHECGDVTSDEEGVELSTMSAVRATAIKEARVIMREEIAFGRLCLGCHIKVRDEHGRTVLKVPFKDAVTISGI